MRKLVVVLVAALGLAFSTPALAWTWPVEGDVVRAYAFGDDPYAAGQHRGIDIGASVGAQVLAPADGVVTYRGFVPSGGLTLSILTEDGYALTLQQLGEIAIAKGDTVGEGVVVASVGLSSDAATPEAHVHLGVRVSSERHGYVDPLSLLTTSSVAPVQPTVDVGSPEPLPEREVAPILDAERTADAPESTDVIEVGTPAPASGDQQLVEENVVLIEPVAATRSDAPEPEPAVALEPVEQTTDPEWHSEQLPVNEAETTALEQARPVESHTAARVNVQPPEIENQPVVELDTAAAHASEAVAEQQSARPAAAPNAEAAHRPVGVAVAIPTPDTESRLPVLAPEHITEPATPRPSARAGSTRVSERAGATRPAASGVERSSPVERRAEDRKSKRGDSAGAVARARKRRAAVATAHAAATVPPTTLASRASTLTRAAGDRLRANPDVGASQVQRTVASQARTSTQLDARPRHVPSNSARSLVVGLLLIALGALGIASVVWALGRARRAPEVVEHAVEIVEVPVWCQRRRSRLRCAVRGLPHGRRSDATARRGLDGRRARRRGRARELSREASVRG
ncbi:MAG: peptidoglycan DD-metalloendopeptidase family protein [Gaiellaceae bacterium]